MHFANVSREDMVVQLVPHERIVERIVELRVSQIQEQMVEDTKVFSGSGAARHRGAVCRSSRAAGWQKLWEMVRITSQELIFDRIDEQIIHVPLSQELILERIIHGSRCKHLLC